MLPADPRASILMRAPNWIGDAVLSLPALMSLRRARPRARLVVATREPALSVFERHPAVDGRIAVPPRGRRDHEVVRRLSREAFAAAVVLSPSFRSVLQLWRASIPVRIGYADDMRGPLLTHVAGKRRGGRPSSHQVRDYLDVVKVAGCHKGDPLPRIEADERQREVADLVLASIAAGERAIVGVAPFAAGGRTKRWPHFARLVTLLLLDGHHVALIGGPGDGRAAAQLADRSIVGMSEPRRIGRRITVLAGDRAVPIVPLAALAGRLSCLVCNDTGPMHAWAAGGGRVVALFGSSLPGLHGPLGPGHTVIHRNALPCAGCYDSRCPHGLECLNEIFVDEVFEAAVANVERCDA